jgi:hypothetical protein
VTHAAAYALRQLEAAARRLHDLREPAGAVERRALTLSAKLAHAAESREIRPEEVRVLFVGADRLQQLATLLAQAQAALPRMAEQVPAPWRDETEDDETEDWVLLLERDCARAGLAAQQTLASVVSQMNLLALEFALSFPEGTPAEELGQLARELGAVDTAWRRLSADVAWAAREAVGQFPRSRPVSQAMSPGRSEYEQ